MSDEIKAAAERWKAMRYGSEATHGSTLNADAYTLAHAYLADLAAHEIEQKLRDIGINEEWLLSIGFTVNQSTRTRFLELKSKLHDIQIGAGKVLLLDQRGQIIQLWVALTTTRGMMLDLLSSLKIPTKAVPQ